MLTIFPHLDLDTLRNMTFWLTFKRGPYGSGTNLTRADVLDMEWEEIRYHWKMLWEVWDAEKSAGK